MKNLRKILLCIALTICGLFMIGCSGCDNCHGKSAYDLAVENGFKGTVDEWLESLKCNDCEDSTPSIFISEDGYWVINGFKSNVKATAEQPKEVEFRFENNVLQWKYINEDNWKDLTTITNGSDGKEVELKSIDGVIMWKYKDADNWETLEDISTNTWICNNGTPNNSIGNNGDLYLDNISFNIYKKINNTWTPIGNIKGERANTIITDTTSPNVSLGINGDVYLNTNTNDLYVKENDIWKKVGNIKGDKGTSIANIDIQYVVVDNELCIEFKFIFDDLGTKTITIPLPKKVVDIELVDNKFQACDTNEGLPTLLLKVTYEDNSTETIPVETSMITSGTINYYQTGSYDITITYMNKSCNETIVIYDQFDRTITSIQATYPNVVMLLSDNTLIKNNYIGLTLTLNFASTETSVIPITDAIITLDETDIVANQIITATVNYKGLTTTFNILPVTNIDKSTVTSGTYIGKTTLSCPLNTEPFNNEYITYTLESTYIFNQPVSSNMLNNLDLTVADLHTATFKSNSIYYNISTNIIISVFDQTSTRAIAVTASKFAHTVTSGIPQIYITATINTGYNYTTYTTLLREDMLDGSHSFTTVGETSVTFSFLDSTYTCTLYLYNTAISNYYGISNLSDLNISINKDADISELKDKIIGKICEIEYFEAVDGFNTKYIKLTEEMLDFSEIDLSITDTQSIKLSIDNNTFEIYVTIY